MANKKNIKIIQLALVVIIGFFGIVIGILFYQHTPKDVSKNNPYSEVINNDIIIIKDAVITSNNNDFAEKYPNELQDIGSIDTTSVQYIKLQKGAILKFDKAVEVKHFVSGIQYVYLLGNLLDKKTDSKIPIAYQWGYFKTICIKEPCNYYTKKLLGKYKTKVY